MTTKIKKLEFNYRLLEALNYFKNENVDDHVKRNVLRYFFVLLDNILKIIGNIKNELFCQNKISLSEKRDIEELIRKLDSDYSSNYDLIRDKFGAHQQEVPLIDLIDWWNEIDLSTCSILYDDVCRIKNKINSAFTNSFDKIDDYSPLDFSNANFLRNSEDDYYFSNDRLAQTQKNTTSLINTHNSQEKAQIILSIIPLVCDNCAITVMTDNPGTVYKNSIHMIAWLLIICDCCSLLDNLYEDISNNYVNSKSLLQIWKENKMKGYHLLSEGNSNRDIEFEKEIREVRNRMGAHIDQALTLKEILSLYYKIDLTKVHSYFFKHANIFREGALKDNRTKIFGGDLYTELKNVQDLSYTANKSFNN